MVNYRCPINTDENDKAHGSQEEIMADIIISSELQEKLEACGSNFRAVTDAATEAARNVAEKAEVALEYAKVLLKKAKIGF